MNLLTQMLKKFLQMQRFRAEGVEVRAKERTLSAPWWFDWELWEIRSRQQGGWYKFEERRLADACIKTSI